MKAKSLFILLLAGCLFCTGCGEKQNVSQDQERQEIIVEEMGQNKVDISILTDETKKHSVSENMMANDCSTYQAMEDQSECILYGKKVREYLKQPDFKGDTYDLMAEIEVQNQIKSGNKKYQAGNLV
ncbi:MAG: hypothetical protein NC293_09330 [Roseburia sp.]|nr:hypothetical protein [Roseburia sp.]